MVLQRLALKVCSINLIKNFLDRDPFGGFYQSNLGYNCGAFRNVFAIKDDAEVGEEFPEDNEALRNFKILSASIC
ncbi:hypothetical protein Plhal304r1_c046g0127121 [Plasmopara halstedii]